MTDLRGQLTGKESRKRCEYLRIKRAAAMFNTTQSAISTPIQELEVSTGLALFDRNQGGARLTEHGEQFLARPGHAPHSGIRSDLKDGQTGPATAVAGWAEQGCGVHLVASACVRHSRDCTCDLRCLRFLCRDGSQRPVIGLRGDGRSPSRKGLRLRSSVPGEVSSAKDCR